MKISLKTFTTSLLIITVQVACQNVLPESKETVNQVKATQEIVNQETANEENEMLRYHQEICLTEAKNGFTGAKYSQSHRKCVEFYNNENNEKELKTKQSKKMAYHKRVCIPESQKSYRGAHYKELHSYCLEKEKQISEE